MPSRKTKAPEPQQLPVAGTPKKPRKTAPSEPVTDLQLVSSALGEGGSGKGACPEAARAMLSEALPHATARLSDTGTGTRHAYQEEMVALIKKVLQEDTVAVSDAHAKSMERAQEADRELERLEARRTQAAEALAAADSDVVARSEAVRTASREVELADANQALAQAATKQFTEAHKKIERERVKIGDITRLFSKERGALSMAELFSVVGLLEDIRAEKALIAAVHGSLSRAPNDRGRFDKITVESVEEVVGAEALKLDGEIATSKPRVEEENAMALGMWAIYDVARDHKAETLEAAKAAEARRDEAAAEERAAARQTEETTHRVKDVIAAKAISEEALAKSKVALEALARLCMPPPEEADEERVKEADAGGVTEKVDKVSSSPTVATPRVGG